MADNNGTKTRPRWLVIAGPPIADPGASGHVILDASAQHSVSGRGSLYLYRPPDLESLGSWRPYIRQLQLLYFRLSLCVPGACWSARPAWRCRTRPGAEHLSHAH